MMDKDLIWDYFWKKRKKEKKLIKSNLNIV